MMETKEEAIGFENIFNELKSNVITLRKRNVKKTREVLLRLKTAIETNEEKICNAIYSDFGKSPAETKLTEIYPAISELKTAIRKLKKWKSDKKVPTPIAFAGAKSFIRYESKGVILIISPWNYPFLLSISPLVSAIAAGNAVVLKPSEISDNTANFLSRFISDIFPPNEVAVINGGAKVTQKLLDFPFNHIFFTGGTFIGKKIMLRASEKPTDITLELGGKSPAIISEKYKIEVAAEKIIWGKLINAGQTCIAPDYLILHESKLQEFISAARKVINRFYGNIKQIENNSDYASIISDAHFLRLKFLLEDSIEKGAKIELGGKFYSEKKVFQPTILSNLNFEMKIMKEEIFGPLLPILTFKKKEEIPELVDKNNEPLALYLFSKEKEFTDFILENIQSGGVTINNTIIHFANNNLPFGGVGKSGIGRTHGFYGFRTFSVERSILKQSPFSLNKILYPPYSQTVRKLIDWTTEYF